MKNKLQTDYFLNHPLEEIFEELKKLHPEIPEEIIVLDGPDIIRIFGINSEMLNYLHYSGQITYFTLNERHYYSWESVFKKLRKR
ncbi:hypothetical protein [Sinomicrobium soli]|uniref:hypothetical protein n=1 Tax=Sinomicrobium sp. N-1-3-6 TaxID=2219864 RepID=UPI000DCD1551|nr:hypothetical protein [Sinomicrobium sp. N-1-3-6]RAV30206.1 hypothetical protein DN748_05280 [Sinomicrobium sp. N-1-3-6]